jgi:hypothetical protein
VVRKWDGEDYGPGGKTVFLTNGSVDKPLQPFDDDDDRSLIEHCCIKETKQQWDLGHPPQKDERAVRVHVVFTLVMFALRRRIGCSVSEKTGAVTPSAGSAGGASSWSRPEAGGSYLPKGTMSSSISPSTRCC